MENQLNNVPESIWADGVPANIKDEDRLKNEDLMGLAIDFVMSNIIIERGFKIERTFPRLTPPQIICKKDGVVYAIVVGVSMYPEASWLVDSFRKDFYKKAVDQGLVPLFAPVAFESIDKDRAEAKLALKGDVFKNHFIAMIKVTDADKMTPADVNESMYFKIPE